MDPLLGGLAAFLQPPVLISTLVGVVAGIIVGLIPGFTITMGVILVLPLAFIWYAEAFGSYAGPSYSSIGRYRPTPAIMLSIGGWILLVGFPLLAILLMM